MNLTFVLPSYIFFISNIIVAYSICQGIGNKYFLNDFEKKTWRDNVESLIQLIIIMTISFILGNYSNTYPNIATIMIILFAPIFIQIFIGEFCIHSIYEFSEWDTEEIIINSFFIIFLIIMIGGHLFLTNKFNNLRPYIGSIIVLVSLLSLLYISSFSEDSKRQYFHLQYWFVAWLLTFFTRYPNTTLSEIGSGVSIAFVIQSFSIYKNNFDFYKCKQISNIRCGGLKVCDPINEIDSNDYKNVNWLSPTIIFSIFMLFIMFYKYSKINLTI